MYKLLVVDDNYTHVKFVLDCIDWGAMGFTDIHTAGNGLEGYDKYKETKPDLIITDVAMPISDGLEMVKKIREDDSFTEVIFMSCYEDFKYVKASVGVNAVSYILKPINPSELMSSVETVLARFKTAQHFFDLFLNNLLFSKHVDPSSFDSLQRSLGASKYSCFMMVKYLILENARDYSKVYALESLLTDSLSPRYSLKPVILSPNELAVLFMFDEESPDVFLETFLEDLGENIADLCSDKRFKISAGVSKITDNITEAKTLLEQARQSFNNTGTPKSGEIYFYEDTLSAPSSAFNIAELKTDIYAFFENNKHFPIDAFMKKYFSSNKVYISTELNQLCLSVVTITQLLFLERNISIDQIFDEPNIIWKKLSDFSSILNVKQWIKNFLIACFDYSSDAEEYTYPNMVSAIKDYINLNYPTITSVSQIASNLYISPGYAKNVFKKHTQQTISEYLLDVRIKNACKLLKNPNLKVYEVQKRVGYQSKAHFTEVFKRKTGKTPKEYQQNPS